MSLFSSDQKGCSASVLDGIRLCLTPEMLHAVQRSCRHKRLPTLNVGVYEIVNRDGRKTSFAYKLEIPQEPGEVQQELQIKKEASYTLSIKVPLQLALFFVC